MPIPRHIRISFTAVVCLIAIAGGACASADDDPADTTTTTTTTTATTTTAQVTTTTEAATTTSEATEPAEGFPVTINHKFGETTIPDRPTRVVSVGYNEHDFLLSLGVVPVGVRDWYGDQPNSVWPWGQEALGGAEPAIVGDTTGLNYEAIAAAKPDVIVGIWSGMTDGEYELLSEIAPTIAQPDDYIDYGTPWQEQTMILGQVTGRTAEAEAAVARVQERITQARADNPDWEGRTAAVGFYFEGNPGAYNSEDPRSRFLTDLGFVIPGYFDESADDSFFFASSGETLVEDFDVDLVVWIAGAEEQYADLVAALPTRPALRAHQDGAELFGSTLLTGAFSHSSPLSLEFVLDTLVPELQLAMDGDPCTLVPSAVEFGTVACSDG